jgi:hypothetical protein
VTAGAPAWLQVWNPTTSIFAATFGLFQGSGRRIYQREMYSGSP